MRCSSHASKNSLVLHTGGMAPDTDGSDEVSTAWRAEAAIRLAGIRASTVELVNADEHYAELRASLNASS